MSNLHEFPCKMKKSAIYLIFKKLNFILYDMVWTLFSLKVHRKIQNGFLGRFGHTAIMDIMRGPVRERGERGRGKKKEEIPLLGEGRGDEGFF